MKSRTFILTGITMFHIERMVAFFDNIKDYLLRKERRRNSSLKITFLVIVSMFFITRSGFSQSSSSPFAQLVSINHFCNGNPGSIEFEILGDPGAFQYYWAHGPTELHLTDLLPGTYTLIVIDFLGCVEEYTVEILNLSQCVIKYEIVPTDDPCVSYIVITFYGPDGEILEEDGLVIEWEDGADYGLKRKVFTSELAEYCVTIATSDEVEPCCKLTECITVPATNCFQICDDDLIVNEVNRNVDGRGQYIELLVLGKCDCGRAIDLRGFILDDNNGHLIPANEFVNYYNLEESIGANTGFLSFSYSDVWAEVPNGSLIVIYDQSDNAISNFPADDPTDVDQDGVYVLQASNTEYFNARMGVWNENDKIIEYGGLLETPSWERINISAPADGIQIRNGDGTFRHGISFGTSLFAEINTFPLWLQVAENTSRNCQLLGSEYENIDGFICYEYEALLHSPGLANSPENEAFRNSLRSCDSIPSIAQGFGVNSPSNLGFQGKPLDEQLTVFPNPFTNQINIEFKSEIEGKSILRLLDLSGKIILSKEITTMSGANTYGLLTDSSMPIGVLILEFTFPSGFKMNRRLTHYQLD